MRIRIPRGLAFAVIAALTASLQPVAAADAGSAHGLPASAPNSPAATTAERSTASTNAAVASAGPGGHIFWSNFGSGTIGRADLDGSNVDQGFISGASGPMGLAANSSYLYWANYNSGTIGRASLDGSNVNQTFIGGLSGQFGGPSGVAVDSSYIYWANWSNNTIGRAVLDGSSVNQAFITGVVCCQEGLAVDPTHIYWTEFISNSVLRANLDGSSVQAFITYPNAVYPHGVAVNPAYLYWGNGSTYTIGRTSLDGSNVNANFISLGSNVSPSGIGVDSGHIYWTDPEGGRIGRANTDGSNVDLNFISGASTPSYLAVVENSVTWTGAAGDGRWNTANNWWPTRVPTALDAVTIDATTTVVADGTAISFASLTLGNAAGSTAPTLLLRTTTSSGGNVTINGHATWTHGIAAAVALGGNVAVRAGGMLTQTSNGATNSQMVKLNLAVAGDFSLQAGALVDVSAQGFVGAQTLQQPGFGPGGGGATADAGGGGYGGAGGNGSTAQGGVTYGSTMNPTDLGSGGGMGSTLCTPGNGGGAFILAVGGTASINGAIRANGGDVLQSCAGGSGSGGSVSIFAGAVTGSGSLSARGGDNVNSDDGAGGGGRIFVKGTANGFAGTCSAAGGTNLSNAARSGRTGTNFCAVFDEGTPPSFSNGQVSADGSVWSAAATASLTSGSSVQARVTVQDADGGLLTSVGGYSARYTTNGGATWTAVPSADLLLNLLSGGTNTSPYWLSATGLDLANSTSASTNQIQFSAIDQAGNVGSTTFAIQVSADSTPPVITPNVAGTLGINGWYTSDVTVNWSVTDPESAVTSMNGCDVTTISTDTAGTTLTCIATSSGGTSSKSVTIKRDATAPTLAPSTSPNPVIIGSTAAATPNASDALSGLASQSCDLLDVGTLGTTSASCTATDNAGNSSNAVANDTVVGATLRVTFSSGCGSLTGNNFAARAGSAWTCTLTYTTQALGDTTTAMVKTQGGTTCDPNFAGTRGSITVSTGGQEGTATVGACKNGSSRLISDSLPTSTSAITSGTISVTYTANALKCTPGQTISLVGAWSATGTFLGNSAWKTPYTSSYGLTCQ